MCLCLNQELVQYYQTNSLERSFPEVPIVLGLPYKDAIEPSPQGLCPCTVYTSLLHTVVLTRLEPQGLGSYSQGLKPQGHRWNPKDMYWDLKVMDWHPEVKVMYWDL